jgi:SPX domain protein involved in polyphosphate accumulation
MADLAERWEDEQLSQVVEAVDATLEAVKSLLSREESEVQERVRDLQHMKSPLLNVA